MNGHEFVTYVLADMFWLDMFSVQPESVFDRKGPRCRFWQKQLAAPLALVHIDSCQQKEPAMKQEPVKLYLVEFKNSDTWMTREAVSELDGDGFVGQMATVSQDGTVRLRVRDTNGDWPQKVCVSPGVYTDPTVPGVLDAALRKAVDAESPGFLSV